MKKPLPADRKEECLRLKAIFTAKKKQLKLTQEKLAEQLGINQSSVSHYLNGVNPLNTEIAAAFAKILDVPVSDFSPRLAGIIEMVASSRVTADSFRTTWAKAARIIDAPPREQYVLIPQYLDDNSFVPNVNDEHRGLTEGMVFRRGWLQEMGVSFSSLNIVYAGDDSMAPHILSGDVVMIDTYKPTLKDGEVYLVRMPDGRTSVRRVAQQISGNWMLRCDNQDKQLFPDELIPSSAAVELPLIGRVVWRGGSVRVSRP
ncbi:LexA family transcriptional regulator [Pseudomonas sp. Z1-29]|uniref:LexA family transcriptional regulator n=1 Tax=Pseudomonas sp. Z1-29 TaxID=2817410 RepID=UPI003DA9D1DE